MRCCLILCVLSITIFVAGCGESGPNLQPGKGVVLLDGTPVPKAIVTFVSKEGPSSVGEADENGNFVLYGPGSKPGIVPGEYNVLVQCPYDPNQGSSADGSAPAASSGPTCKVPEKYVMRETSDLTETIPEGGNESISIELVSK